MITREVVEGAYPTKLLGEVCLFLDHRRRPVKQSERKSGTFPYYGANGLQGTIDSFIFDEPLILLAEDGGHFDEPDRGIAYEISGKTWVNNHAHVLKPRAANLDLSYLRRVLENYDVRPFINGSTRSKLTKAQAERIPIPLPPIDEQRRIAAILEQADDLRRKRRRILRLLDDLAQSVFVEMFGEMIDRGDVRYPIAPFAELLSSQKIGLVRAASELSEDAPIPYLRMDAIALDGQLDLEGTRRTHASESEISEYALRPGDFLFNTRNSRELVGKAAVFDGPDGYIYNNNILRVRFAERLRPEYASAFFRTPLGRSELELRKSGTTSVYAIYQKSLDTMPIVVPPINDQTKFAKIISKIRKQKENLRDAQRQLAQLFSSLQHRAFSGQL